MTPVLGLVDVLVDTCVDVAQEGIAVLLVTLCNDIYAEVNDNLQRVNQRRKLTIDIVSILVCDAGDAVSLLRSLFAFGRVANHVVSCCFVEIILPRAKSTEIDQILRSHTCFLLGICRTKGGSVNELRGVEALFL